jgi:hypothetical protein
MGPNCSRLCGYSPPAIVACLSHKPAANPTLTSLKRGEVASADAARHIVVLMFSLNEYTQISVKNIKIIALTNYFPPPPGKVLVRFLHLLFTAFVWAKSLAKKAPPG